MSQVIVEIVLVPFDPVLSYISVMTSEERQRVTRPGAGIYVSVCGSA